MSHYCPPRGKPVLIVLCMWEIKNEPLLSPLQAHLCLLYGLSGTHTCMHALTLTHMYTHPDSPMYACIHTHTHTHTHTHMHSHTHNTAHNTCTHTHSHTHTQFQCRSIQPSCVHACICVWGWVRNALADAVIKSFFYSNSV